jgi:hypothetical protein
MARLPCSAHRRTRLNSTTTTTKQKQIEPSFTSRANFARRVANGQQLRSADFVFPRKTHFYALAQSLRKYDFATNGRHACVVLRRIKSNN